MKIKWLKGRTNGHKSIIKGKDKSANENKVVKIFQIRSLRWRVEIVLGTKLFLRGQQYNKHNFKQW